MITAGRYRTPPGPAPVFPRASPARPHGRARLALLRELPDLAFGVRRFVNALLLTLWFAVAADRGLSLPGHASPTSALTWPRAARWPRRRREGTDGG